MYYESESPTQFEYRYLTKEDVNKDLQLYNMRIETKKMNTKDFIKYCKEHGESVKTTHMLNPNTHVSNNGNETITIFRNINDEIEIAYGKETAFLKSDFTVIKETFEPMYMNTRFNNSFEFKFVNSYPNGVHSGTIKVNTVQDIVDFIYDNPSPETLKITSFDNKKHTTSIIYNGEKAKHMVQTQRLKDEFKTINCCESQERMRQEIEEIKQRYDDKDVTNKEVFIFTIVVLLFAIIAVLSDPFILHLFL